MTSIPTSLKSNLHRARCALLSLFLGLGLVLASICPPSRTLAEEEIETPNCVFILRSQLAQRSPLARLPAPLVVRPQGRALDRGVQTRHGNNEQSKKNGTGSYLII
jgi:hypothetical protein